MSHTDNDKFALSIPIRWEIIFFIIIFGLAVFVRFMHLSADPPDGFALSTGIETDPPGHTLFARNAVLTGEWNPYEDKRFITYQYSLVSGAAWIVYQVFGVGVYQTNLVSVIFSLLSLFLFYLVLRKSNGNAAALIMLFFLAINYIAIFIGRRPLLENGMNLLFITALFCLAYGEKKLWGHFLFGFLAAAAILFGKVIALAFLAVPAVYYPYKIFLLKIRSGYRQAAVFVGGFSLLSLAWYLFVFAPHSSEVSGYMVEQIFGLHGSPEALASVSKFVWKFLVFGMKSAFFERMPAISAAALLFILILGSRMFDRDRAGPKRPFNNLILISITAWLLGTFIGELPWNYLPLRYLCAMIYPLAALTAVLVVYLYKLNEKVNLLNRSVIFNLILFVLTLTVAYQAVRLTVTRLGGLFTFTGYFTVILAGVLLVVFAYFMTAWKKREYNILLPRYFRYSIIGLIAVVSIYSHGSNYYSWAKCPLHTMSHASHDLGLILSPAAVVSGPYGPALALENEIGAIVHYFGTTRPDPTLFERFPVTHLALDKSNEEIARRIYPKIMECSRLVCNYNINTKRVSVYNISHCTGNADAITYSPTIFEKAILYFAANRAEPGITTLNQFVSICPENMSGHTWAGIHCLEIEDFDKAIGHFEKAVEFSYTDFNLHFFLGNAYIGKSYESGDDRYRIMAESEINLARTYSLGKFNLDDYIIKDPKDRENGRNGK